MKIKPSEADRFAAKPDSRIRAVLVYGPDSGLIRERMNALAKSVVDDLSDPFRISDLTDADIRQDSARLADEAAAIAMLGGRRIVRIRGAGDPAAKIIESFLADPKGDALIIVEGGELGPRSSLRKLFEENASTAAIPCYADDAATLEDTIRKRLARDNLVPEPAALQYLTSHLGSDRGVTMNELEKLALYMGPQAAGAKPGSEKQTVTLADVRACVGDNADSSMDDVVDATTGGDVAALDLALARARSADLSPIALLNALSRHLVQLHLAVSEIETGTPTDIALRGFRPPVHFSRASAVRRQVSLWNRRRLDRALTLIIEADTQCKTTGLPENAVCGQTLLRIAQAARAGAR